MARDDLKSGGNGGDDVKAERGMATLSTLRYGCRTSENESTCCWRCDVLMIPFVAQNRDEGNG